MAKGVHHGQRGRVMAEGGKKRRREEVVQGIEIGGVRKKKKKGEYHARFGSITQVVQQPEAINQLCTIGILCR